MDSVGSEYRRQEAPYSKYELLFQAITGHAIYLINPDGIIRSWHAGAECLQGYPADEAIGRPFEIFYSEQDRAAGLPRQSLDAALRDGQWSGEGWRTRQDGTLMWVGSVIYPVYEAGTHVGFVKIVRQRAEAWRQPSTAESMAIALSLLPNGVCLVDTAGVMVLANPAFHRLFPGVQMGAHIRDANAATAAFELGTPECEIASGDRILACRSLNAPGQGWVVTAEDVTGQRRAERDVLFKAHHDALTGLANRERLEAHLDLGLEACRATGGCAVIYLDLDRFKAVNDTYGHQAGDMILKEAADRIRSVLRPDDFISRLGGDEFVVVPQWPLSEGDATCIATRLKAQLDRSFMIDERRIELGVSIGVAVSSPNDSDRGGLMEQADRALYEAKRKGRGHIRSFDTGLADEAERRHIMEVELARGLDAQAFSLVYQPIYDVTKQAVLGFEAFLRWRRADGTVLSPAEFLPLAEEIGALAEIGTWVLDTACRAAVDWPEPLFVSVNISLAQLRDPGLLVHVRNALLRTNLHPSRLEIEIPERAMMMDHKLPLDILAELRDLGVGIAIDDFGTGFLSLATAPKLPVTRVKIDQSFVSDLTSDRNALAAVRAMLRMSQDIGLAVTAEGVETEAQRAVLAAEACQDMQGFLFARPMRQDKVLPFLGYLV